MSFAFVGPSRPGLTDDCHAPADLLMVPIRPAFSQRYPCFSPLLIYDLESNAVFCWSQVRQRHLCDQWRQVKSFEHPYLRRYCQVVVHAGRDDRHVRPFVVQRDSRPRHQLVLCVASRFHKCHITLFTVRPGTGRRVVAWRAVPPGHGPSQGRQ